MEAFPYRFTNGIRAIWRRRKYQRLEVPRKKTVAVTRLGDGRGRSNGNRRGWKLRSVFRIRIKILSPLKVLSPVRLLTWIRESYVDAMLGLAQRGTGLGAGPESHWDKRVPRARSVRSEPGDFEKRLIIEVYKSLVASGEIVAQ